MGGFVLAWLAGESIVIWRWAKLKAPPTPGALALPSVIFVGLAVVAQYEPARTTATVTAWALDLAILLQVVGKTPAVTTGWPPPQINDPTVILPTGNSSSGPSPAAGSAPAKPAGGQSVPSKIASGIKNVLL